MPLRSEGDSHKHDGVNYFHLCVNPQTNKWHEQPSSSVDQHNHMVFIIEGVEVLEIKQYHTSRIISKPITIGVLVPIYSSMSSQFSSAPLKLNKF
jgi:hypothetical protein